VGQTGLSKAAGGGSRKSFLGLPGGIFSKENIAVPDALASYVVEAARASDYDHLLLGDGDTHE
jgi:hypothetical protein